MPITRSTLVRPCLALAACAGAAARAVAASAAAATSRPRPTSRPLHRHLRRVGPRRRVRAARSPLRRASASRTSASTPRHEYKRALKGFAAQLSAADVRALRRDPEVALVSPDLQVHALACAPLAAGESVPTGVARIEAANAREGHEASSVGVAVLDTGIDLDHPDLVAQDGKNCIASGSADDDNGHGTHVAGTIGARNQGAGVVGVAPGTTLYAVKVLDARAAAACGPTSSAASTG